MDYIIHIICVYPTLYANRSFMVSRMKIMDQVLNTIGNGIRDDEELMEQVKFKPRHTRAEADKWMREPVYWGYKKVIEKKIPLGNGKFHTWVMSDPSCRPVHLVKSEIKSHPEIIHTLESKKYPFEPYPNFQKEYSLVWRCPAFFTLGKDWTEEAILFYKYCRKWLKQNESKYHYAFPRENEKTTAGEIKEFKSYIKGKTRKQITKDYGLEYKGNVRDFLTRRWQKEKTRIDGFISETLEMLKSQDK